MCGASLLLFALFAAAALAATGALTQLSGDAGCVAPPSSSECADANGLNTPLSVALSPDGTSVYPASENLNAVSAFSRNVTTGELTQLSGEGGCVTENSSTVPACADGEALGSPQSIALSPDGRSLYVAAGGSNAVAVFSRNTTTGELTQLSGTDSCVSEDGTGGACADGKALEGPSSVTVSPDGKSVYVTALFKDAVAVFSRDKTTGKLTQLSGDDGCVQWVGQANAGCTSHNVLDNPLSVAVSPDGKSVYVAAAGSSSAVDVFSRNTTTGKLTQLTGNAKCVSDDGSNDECENGQALQGATSVAVSRDKKSVYVASAGSDAVAIFKRNTTTGKLTQPADTAGCVSEDGGPNCIDGKLLAAPVSVAVSRDKQSVYVASRDSDALAVFSRNTTSGALTQLPDPEGCVTDGGNFGGQCTQAKALDSPRSAAVSSERKPISVYVASRSSDGVAVFRRSR